MPSSFKLKCCDVSSRYQSSRQSTTRCFSLDDIALSIKYMSLIIFLENIENQSLAEFLKECSSMHKLDHPNVLQLLGICVDHPDIEGPLILSVYMEKGDLRSYLCRQYLLTGKKSESNQKAMCCQQVNYIRLS